MFIINLPSLNLCLEFDGDQWLVNEATPGDDTVALAASVLDHQSIASFIMNFRFMWTLACIRAKENDKVLPMALPEVAPVDMSFWGFDRDHSILVAGRPFGNVMSYDPGESEYTTESLLNLFYQCIVWAGKEHPHIIGAINHNYVKVSKVYLKANITGQCVVFSSDTKKWETTTEQPVGERLRTNVGISAYISDGGYDIDESVLPIGYGLLADEVTGVFSVMLIADLPEATFNKPEETNKYERMFELNTNAMRLLYYLNANPTVPVVKEETPVVIERGVLPTVTFSIADGTPVPCGGSFAISGGHGTFSVYDVVKWLKSSCDKYAAFASKFDDAVISKNAFNVFNEQFGAYRTVDAHVRADMALPLQMTSDMERWLWSDSGWTQMYGSDATYADEVVAVIGELSAHYVDKDVDMTEAAWGRLLLSTLASFMLPVKGLAALYYRTAENPDADDETDAVLTIIDPKTLTKVTWSDNAWNVEDCGSFHQEGTTDDFGMLITCSNASNVSGRMLAKLLPQILERHYHLRQIRADRREELAGQMVYGDYETLKVCVPESAYVTTQNISTGFVSGVDSPVVLYDGKTRICHTTRGWAVNNIAADKTKKVGKVGRYDIGFEAGNVEWGTDSEKFICELIALTADYTDDVTQASRLLAIDF